jgi:hypothetical protein
MYKYIALSVRTCVRIPHNPFASPHSPSSQHVFTGYLFKTKCTEFASGLLKVVQRVIEMMALSLGASDAGKMAKPTRALFTTYYPLAVPTHVLPSCCALCCCCCCCCMLRLRARVVARLTTYATPLLSPLWLLLLYWLYSCAPLWAGVCIVDCGLPSHTLCMLCLLWVL